MPAGAPGSVQTCQGLAGEPRVPESPVGPGEEDRTRRSPDAAGQGPGQSRHLDARVTELAVTGGLQPRRARLPGRETHVELDRHRDGERVRGHRHGGPRVALLCPCHPRLC